MHIHISHINLSLCFVHTIKVLDEITEENNSFQKDITRLRPILDNVQKVDIMLKSGELMSTVQLNQGTIELDQDDDEEERGWSSLYFLVKSLWMTYVFHR